MNAFNICEDLPFPASNKNNIAIVMSFSKAYMPYSCITIYSIMKVSKPDNYYDFIIFSSDALTLDETPFKKIVQKYSNVSFRVINTNSFALSDFFVEGHLGIETYSRLLIPKFMKYYEKAVYLDSDIIVLKDIAELYNYSINESTMIAGVPDLDVMGQFYGADPSMKYYIKKKVRIDNPDKYLQAGVLIFNIKSILDILGDNVLIEYAEKSRLRYFDQDVLNYLCHKESEIIDFRWNVVCDCDNIRISKVFSNLPSCYLYDYQNSRNDPWIIHYSGRLKPWVDRKSDFADVYWSLFEEAGLMPLPQSNIKKGRSWRIHLFPYGTYRRTLFKTIYFSLKYKKIKEKKI